MARTRRWRGPIERLADAASCVVAETRLDDTMAAIAAPILAGAPPRSAVAGVSMGGYVAFELWRQAPERVTRLALFDTGARADAPKQSERRRQAMAALDHADLATLGRFSLPQPVAPDASDAGRAEVVAMGVRVGRAAYERQQRANIARPDSPATLAAITVPTMVVVGELDVLTPPELAGEMAARIPGATLHSVPGSGHLPPIEKPDKTAALLRDWLAD